MAAKVQQVGGFAGWVIRFVQQNRERKAAKGKMPRLAMIETLSLGGRRQIALVECDGQRFLVGMTADSVTAISPAGSVASPVPVGISCQAPEEEQLVYAYQSEAPRAAHRLVRFGGGL